VPTLVVGGGGYTLRNVARCWCYETGRLMGHDLPDKLPDSVLNSFNYYMDNEKLRIEVRTGPGGVDSGSAWPPVRAGGTAGLQYEAGLPSPARRRVVYATHLSGV
jgi:histone deacetylase 1/2